MKLRLALLIVLLYSFCCLARTDIGYLKPYASRTIRNIEVIRKNIFDDLIASRAKSPFYYRWANSLHIMTRDYVIRRELLFKVGDKLDLEKVFESERNLRLGGFIGEVNVTAVADDSEGVDLNVETTDLWTTKISAYADVAGGKYATGVDLIEQNLLGWGKMIDILGQVGNDQDGYHLLYYDSRLAGSRLALGLTVYDFTFENGLAISLGRPKYSLSVPISFAGSYSHFHSRPRLFHNGDEYFRYRNNKDQIEFEGQYSFGRARRLSIIAGANYEKNEYSPDDLNSIYNYLIPPSETMSFPFAGLSGAIIQYDVERFLDAAGTPEDLTLGAALRVTLGHSAKTFGATYMGNRPIVNAQFLTKPYQSIFIGGVDNISWWRHNGRDERIRHISEVSIYLKPRETHVFVFHALTDFAWRQKSNYQVYLGGGNGLRGHSFYALAGTKSAVANLEYRFYSPIEILTVRLGAAAFFDIGNVWQINQYTNLRDLKTDYGIGLRLGLTRSASSRVVNFDIAKSFSHHGVFVTFSSSTSMFRLSEINTNE
jgi:outer membrane protein assembly factor BamA